MMGMDMMTLARMLQGGGRSAQQGVRKLGNVFNPQAGLGEGAPVDPNGMFAQIGGDGPKDLRRPAAPQPVEPEKTPWMQQKALGGFERGDLLLAGMGMLGGKNFKEGLGNASGVAYDAFGRQREEGEKRKQSEALVKAMVAKGVPVEEATAMAEFGPGIAFNDVYNTQAKDWREQRTAIEDDRYEAQWLRDQGRYENDQERLERLEKYGIARDKVTDGQWQSEFGLRKTEAESNGGAGSYGLNVVWGKDENGNPVAMQASKGGGLRPAETPEGVSLLDPYQTSYDRKAGSERAGKDAYQTDAGLAVIAAEDAFSRISTQIDNAIETSNSNNTGLIMGNAPAPNLDGLLDTIGANTAFDTLVSLKSQGGTLGAISQSELDLLKAKVASLKRSQSQEQLDTNLELLRAAMQNSMTRIKQAYEAEYANGAYGRATPAPAAGGRVGPSGQPVPEGFE